MKSLKKFIANGALLIAEMKKFKGSEENVEQMIAAFEAIESMKWSDGWITRGCGNTGLRIVGGI